MNIYTLSYCTRCKRLHFANTLSVHGSENAMKAGEMVDDGVPLPEVWQSFCSYCGNYIEGDECACGHTRRQTYSMD